MAYPSSGARLNFNSAYTITALHTATDYNVSGGSTTGSYSWWTMRPMWYNDSYVTLFSVNGSGTPGKIFGQHTYLSGSVIRPVVSLKSSVLVTGGSGTGNDPYTVALP